MNIFSIGIFENPRKFNSPIHSTPILISMHDDKSRRLKYTIGEDYNLQDIHEFGNEYANEELVFVKNSYFFHEPKSYNVKYQTIYIHGRGVIYGKNKFTLALSVTFWCLLRPKNHDVKVFLQTIKNIYT